MKGFYITVKNGLLDPKHIKAMGGDKGIGTIWLFLWFLDKMTIVDEEIGEGKVLGGKPIKYEEIKKDLGISRRTYQRWVSMLSEEGYIKTLRTPYGLVVTVYKAFKVFSGKKDDKNNKSQYRSVTEDTSSDEPTKAHLTSHKAHLYTVGGTSNKTIQKTIQLDNISSKATALRGNEWNDLIDLFKPINPFFEEIYKNTTERKSLQTIVDKIGFTMTKRAILAAVEVHGELYAPKISKPSELKRDFSKLTAFYKTIKKENKIVII